MDYSVRRKNEDSAEIIMVKKITMQNVQLLIRDVVWQTSKC